MHPLLAGFVLAWREKTRYPKDNVFPSVKLGWQEAAVGIHHGTEIPEARRGQSWCDRDRLEGSLWFSQFSALTGNCAGEAESGPEDSAGYAASRGLRHNHGTVRSVRHGVDAG